MTYNEKIVVLESYMILDAYIDELLDEKEKWYSRALMLNKFGDNKKSIEKVCYLEKRIDEKIDELIDLRQYINEAIENLNDLTLQKILYLKYFKGKSFEKIGEEINYCTKQISRLHKKAIEMIDLNK